MEGYPRRTEEHTLRSAELQHGKFWRLQTLNNRDGLSECYCCRRPATGRSSMNIWGTVIDFPSCDECDAVNDGKRADSVPHYEINGGQET